MFALYLSKNFFKVYTIFIIKIIIIIFNIRYFLEYFKLDFNRAIRLREDLVNLSSILRRRPYRTKVTKIIKYRSNID